MAESPNEANESRKVNNVGKRSDVGPHESNMEESRSENSCDVPKAVRMCVCLSCSSNDGKLSQTDINFGEILDSGVERKLSEHLQTTNDDSGSDTIRRKEHCQTRSMCSRNDSDEHSDSDVDSKQRNSSWNNRLRERHLARFRPRESSSTPSSKLSSFSSTSSEDDDEDDMDSIIDMKKVKFPPSSSSSSSDMDDISERMHEFEGLVEYLSSGQSIDFDDDAFLDAYWDSGSIEYFHGENHPWGNVVTDSEFERLRQVDLSFPHRALRLMECEICLETSYLRRRVCCDFQICNTCLATYITLKVKDGQVQIECPNDRCGVLVYKDEIRHRLCSTMREKFAKYLIDANADPNIKTCPCCSLPYEIDSALLEVSKKKLKNGLKVVCSHCKLEWCFPCQAPFHSTLTCKKYRKGDVLVKKWAKEKRDGQSNAQKCPKCKIFIQKMDGCDHMKCTKCQTDFCYRCGDRYISVKLLGNHWSRFSLFGCKYRLLPHKPGLRKFIRGTNFAARLMAAMVIAGLGIMAGAVLVGASVFILPGYGIVRLRRRMWAAKKRKTFLKQKMMMIAAVERGTIIQNCHEILLLDAQGYMSTIPEESETETSNPTCDAQQVQVLVHRSVSFNREETEVRSRDRECDVLINKYTNDGSEVTVTMLSDENGAAGAAIKDDVISKASVQEIQNESGYSRMVLNVVSTVNQGDSGNNDDAPAENLGENADDAIVEHASDECALHAHLDINAKKSEQHVNRRKDNSLTKDSFCLDSSEMNKSSPGELKQTSTTTTNSPAILHDKDNGKDTIKSSVADTLTHRGDTKQTSSVECHQDKKVIIEEEEKLKEKDKESLNFSVKGKNSLEKAQFSDKTLNNGCFGNIFSSSKRVGSANPGHNEVVFSKADRQPKAKSPTHPKAATWEKCRGTKIDAESIHKLSLEYPADLKHLPKHVHKSSSSISSILSFSYGHEEATKTKGSDYLTSPPKEKEPTDDYSQEN